MLMKEKAERLKEKYKDNIEFVIDYGCDGLDTVSDVNTIRDDETNYGYIINNNDKVIKL